jgi:lipid II:glycine glycyltransferase (peptidoglycan interpeptide bridge formation enzyme)
MNIKILDNSFGKSVFNERARHPLQSWEWGEARHKMGIEVIRLGEYDNDNLINVFQLSFHQLPKTPFKIGYLPRSSMPSDEVVDFLIDFGKKNKIVFIKIEPNELKKSYSKSISGKLSKSSHPLFPNWTMVLDLAKYEDELLKNMKSKTRYNIGLAQRKGVIIREESDEKGFEIFAKLYFETCKKQKYYGHNYEYHQIVWNSLKNNVAHILIAYYNNEPLAAYELFSFNKTFYYPYGGTSEKHRNLMAANLLMWEAIRLGKKLGATKFDMWGSLSPNYNPKHPWAGFTRFKEGYGAECVEMIGSFDLVINPFLYKTYNLVHKLRNVYLGINDG